MFGKAIKKVGSAVTKAAQSAPRLVPNQGYGKITPTGAPQTIPAADRARLDAVSAALRKSPPKMPFGGGLAAKPLRDLETVRQTLAQRGIPQSFGAQPAPTPTNPRQRFGGLGAGFRNEFGGGAGDSGALNSTYRDMKKQMAGIAGTGRQMVMKKGGKVSSASKRADGIAIRGKTRA